ncbi:MAG: tetratricopeptide repeat protein [Flavobacteriales bacterium]
MLRPKFICIFFLNLFIHSIVAQVDREELWSKWSEAKSVDTARASALFALVDDERQSHEYDSALVHATLLLEFSRRIKSKPHEANALHMIGRIESGLGSYEESRDAQRKALKIYRELKDSTRIASSLISLTYALTSTGENHEAVKAGKECLKIAQATGNEEITNEAYSALAGAYEELGNYADAVNYAYKLLTVAESSNDMEKVATAYAKIAWLYLLQDEEEKFVELSNKAVEAQKALGNELALASLYNNMGNAYRWMGDFEKALDYHYKALELRMKNNAEDIVLSFSYNNMGVLYGAMGQFQQGINLVGKALEIRDRSGFSRGVVVSNNCLANLYLKQGDSASNAHDISLARSKYQKSVGYASKAIRGAEEIDHIIEMRDGARIAYLAQKNLGNPAKALEFYEMFVAYRDSIESEENERELIRTEYKYAYEKQAAADSVQAAEAQRVAEAQIAAQEAQLSQERTQRYALFGGLGLLALFGGFMYNRFRVTRKQRDIIEHQKVEVEEAHEQLAEKNKEVLDSIHYAKRIQTAILPPDPLVRESLPNSFILYRPKDVVAGDFYWLEPIGDEVFFAAADCTGHGVPGAMVSVVCVNGLNRCVREFGLRQPSDILDKCRELVIAEFEKSEEEVKDGMDISLCVWNKMINEIRWAGAHNPLWVVRKGAEEVEEYKADKQPIGKYEWPTAFTNHIVSLNSGDTIYVFSDGFPDQFGGETGKKYKSGKFKKTLCDLAQNPIEEQSQLLEMEFNQWRGEIEQIDDVCVIGLTIV